MGDCFVKPLKPEDFHSHDGTKYPPPVAYPARGYGNGGYRPHHHHRHHQHRASHPAFLRSEFAPPPELLHPELVHMHPELVHMHPELMHLQQPELVQLHPNGLFYPLEYRRRRKHKQRNTHRDPQARRKQHKRPHTYRGVPTNWQSSESEFWSSGIKLEPEPPPDPRNQEGFYEDLNELQISRPDVEKEDEIEEEKNLAKTDAVEPAEKTSDTKNFSKTETNNHKKKKKKASKAPKVPAPKPPSSGEGQTALPVSHANDAPNDKSAETEPKPPSPNPLSEEPVAKGNNHNGVQSSDTDGKECSNTVSDKPSNVKTGTAVAPTQSPPHSPTVLGDSQYFSGESWESMETPPSISIATTIPKARSLEQIRPPQDQGFHEGSEQNLPWRKDNAPQRNREEVSPTGKPKKARAQSTVISLGKDGGHSNNPITINNNHVTVIQLEQSRC